MGLPNAYTLTKHMTESLLADVHAAGRLQVAIVRPSVVGGIAHSPLPGYFGNAAGMPAATLAFASGARSAHFARCACVQSAHLLHVLCRLCSPCTACYVLCMFRHALQLRMHSFRVLCGLLEERLVCYKSF